MSVSGSKMLQMTFASLLWKTTVVAKSFFNVRLQCCICMFNLVMHVYFTSKQVKTCNKGLYFILVQGTGGDCCVL